MNIKNIYLLFAGPESGDSATWLGSIIALLALIFTIFIQYKKQNIKDQLGTLLELENTLHERKEKLDAACHEVIQNFDPERKKAALKSIECALESFLNSVDRLCYCIINKHLNEEQMKSEYKEFIDDITNNFKNENSFKGYKNISELHKIWSNS